MPVSFEVWFVVFYFVPSLGIAFKNASGQFCSQFESSNISAILRKHFQELLS